MLAMLLFASAQFAHALAGLGVKQETVMRPRVERYRSASGKSVDAIEQGNPWLPHKSEVHETFGAGDFGDIDGPTNFD
jgi:hypothetical protein